ncbi:MAG: M48 family metallopeptidase [Bdellovibrionaceae bacterium]|jgi:Zn-dependent protease with chaperone function|nr:M48 family metallopeptidase [Pseudobdellovibrionaceae bacterium]
MTLIEAKYYNSVDSKTHLVQIHFDQDKLYILENEKTKSVSINHCKFETPIASNPMIVELPNNERLEVKNSTLLVEELKRIGHKKSFASYHIETNTKLFAVSVLVTISLLVVFIKFGIPKMSGTIAMHAPSSWTEKLDDHILSDLDKHVFSESKLSDETQNQIRHYFFKQSNTEANLLFRKGNQLKANAFALSNNTIVITDELVHSAKNLNHLLAIYLHEYGHLQQKYVLKTIVSSSSLALLSLMLVGDLPGLSESLANLNFVLLSRSYSRGYETSADDYSVNFLNALDKSTRCMSEALLVFKSVHKETSENNMIIEYLATHPNIDLRIAKIVKSYPLDKSCQVATLPMTEDSTSN